MEDSEGVEGEKEEERVTYSEDKNRAVAKWLQLGSLSAGSSPGPQVQ